MKDNFEQNFRDILKGHEEPFDPTAWEQMNASLDASMPVQGSEIAQGTQGACNAAPSWGRSDRRHGGERCE